ncbi:MAG: 30S ribosomal protein S20 [Fimbriimonadaceae bacterium]|nr:30S ribosomal protein S20 [Fimbriimonadaceae bacterium]
MANLKASKKDLRKSRKTQLVNGSVKSSLKTYVRRVREAVASGDETRVKESLVRAQKALDKAAQRGIIHRNQAARRLSRIAAFASQKGDS